MNSLSSEEQTNLKNYMIYNMLLTEELFIKIYSMVKNKDETFFSVDNHRLSLSHKLSTHKKAVIYDLKIIYELNIITDLQEKTIDKQQIKKYIQKKLQDFNNNQDKDNQKITK